MEMKKEGKKPPKDGVLAITLIGVSKDILDQQLLFIQDRDDHGADDGICRYGIVGGGKEDYDKTLVAAMQREFFEEAGMKYKRALFKKFGCYQKKRAGDFINDNYLYLIKLNFSPDQKFCTNDTSEVSDIRIFKLKEIIDLAKNRMVHEGSIRLILLYLSGIKSGSLNEPVSWNGHTF